MKTTDAFHVYRLIKAGQVVSLYVDDMTTPKFSLPYTDLGASGGTAQAFLVNTSSSGTAAFDIASFAYDTGTTLIPEPGMGALGLGLLAMGRRRSSYRRGH